MQRDFCPLPSREKPSYSLVPMGTGAVVRLIDAVTASVLMLAMAAFLHSDAQASLPKTEQDVPVPTPLAVMPQRPAPALPPVPKVRAKPAGNPGEWVESEDYPVSALQFGAQGVVGFRLYIDETGKVTDCWITSSSGVQILDDGACALMLERARFDPARNRKGQAVRDIFETKFAWRIPEGTGERFAENSRHYGLLIDKMGQVTSCFITGISPLPAPDDEGQGDEGCDDLTGGMPSVFALAARNYGPEPTRVVNWDIALFIDRIKADEAFQQADIATTGAMLWNVGVAPDGAVTECTLARQKGNAALLFNACIALRNRGFEAAPATEGAPPRRNGWLVVLIGYKTGP